MNIVINIIYQPDQLFDNPSDNVLLEQTKTELVL